MKPEDFDFIDPKEKPIIYPGKIPKFSFMFDGEEFFKIKIKKKKPLNQSLIKNLNKTSFKKKVKIFDFCKENDITPLSKRRGVLSYGSNCNPAQLKSKFKDNKLKDNIIFSIRCDCTNVDSVYLAKITLYGAIPAGIIPCQGTILKAFILFLTENQLKIMNKTENLEVSYDLKEIKRDCKLENEEYLYPIRTYIPKIPIILDEQNKPIRLKAFQAFRPKLKKFNEEEILKFIIKKTETKDLLLETFHEKIKKNDERIKRIKEKLNSMYEDEIAKEIQEKLIREFKEIKIKKEKIFSFFSLTPIKSGIFQILPISNRSKAGKNYICELNQETMEKFNFKDSSLLLLSKEVKDPFIKQNRIISIQVKCYKNDFLKNNQIGIDQSARNAMGVKKEQESEIIITKNRIKRLLWYK